MLLYFYINNFSIRYTNFGIRGTLGSKFVNHMIEVDDLCIVYLSSSSLHTC